MQNDLQLITDRRTGDFYYTLHHPSGLDILLYPKADFRTTYAMFSTKYGSIDTSFSLGEEETVHQVPAGIAHFLEHKLFESEEGDAFERYAETGANANAYTSFENTCYLFSTTQNAYAALEILLDFVQSPYFTEATVKKEQGIIGQEIKMYDDDPQWRVMINLLRGMYHVHTVREDIAGTIESIAEITPEYLYDCYKTFYNLNNMALVIAGSFETDRVLAMCDKWLKPSEPVKVRRVFKEEPTSVCQHKITQKLSVSSPLFQLGYKETFRGERDEKTFAVTEILLDILASDASPLYKRLYDMELINDASFSYEYFEGEGFGAVLFGGESKDPDRVAAEIATEIRRLKVEGILEEDFERARKSLYGANIAGLNSASTIANALTTLHFKGRTLFRYIAAFAELTRADVELRLAELLDEDKTVLSVILPQE